MNVLITGGSGFLGINLIRFLLNKGFNIRVLDIEDFEYPELNQINFIKGDIRKKSDVEKAMKDTDIVIHCAAALPLYSKQEIMSTDVNGTKLLLFYAAKNKIDRFIHISSTAVYGIPKHHPLFENDKLSGVGAYGEAKILAEQACLSYRKIGMNVPILRPKSFVGPERLGVFAIYFDWIKDGKNIPIVGKGDNKYQLLDVEDLCEAIFLCMTREKKVTNDTFNIGAKVYSTMKEDFGSVIEYAGTNKKIISTPAKPLILLLRFLEFLHLSPLYKWVYETAPEDSFVSIRKAEQKLGFIPKYSNKDALIRTYYWYINNYKEYNNKSGVTHRVPWKQGILRFFKLFF